jgi:hypothetical protein
MTGTSTLDPDNFPEAPDRSLGKGHGVDALGPSDLSDTGSDVVGGPGFASNIDPEQTLDFDGGTTSDLEAGHAGDAVVRDGADIDTDRIESIPDLPLTEDDTDFLTSLPPGQDVSR